MSEFDSHDAEKLMFTGHNFSIIGVVDNSNVAR